MSSPMIRKLNALLKTERMGKVLHYFEEVDSTNNVLFDLAGKGASEGTVVIADAQTGGKGRLGRKWVSPGGHNLYISVLLRPDRAASESALLTLLASIAVYECLKKTGIQAPSIKWPNDITIERRKVSGILTEMEPVGERAEFIVLGIGVNVNMSRALMNREMGEFARQATSVSENLGREVDRAKFTADLLLELEKWYGIMNSRGKSEILKEWTKRWGGKNDRVRVSIEGRESYEAVAEGIDTEGFLEVRKEDGEIERVISGDVTIIS